MIDQRGARGGGLSIPGGTGGRIGGGLGLVGVLIFVALQLLGGGGDAFSVDPGFGGGIQAPGQPAGIPAGQDPERQLKEFSTYVFTDSQETWASVFGRSDQPYDNAQLVLYRGGVNTGCGGASSAVGPFYCPTDRRVYLDLSFYGDMQRQLGRGR